MATTDRNSDWERIVTDEIYDYFGGNSSRKVEPLDESELFETEGQEKASSGTSEIVESIEVTETIEIVATSQSLGVETGSEEQDGSSKAGPKKTKQPSGSRPASSGKPVPAHSASKQKPAKPAGAAFGAGLFDESAMPQQDSMPGGTTGESVKDESRPSDGPDASPETDADNSPSSTQDFFGLDSQSDSKPEDGPAVLSEMFVPSPFDSHENEQPPTGNADDSQELETDGMSAGGTESNQISEEGEDFFEFEVEDLEEIPEQATPQRRRNRQGNADDQGESRDRPRGESRERSSDSKGGRRSRNTRRGSRESGEEKDDKRHAERARNKRDSEDGDRESRSPRQGRRNRDAKSQQNQDGVVASSQADDSKDVSSREPRRSSQERNEKRQNQRSRRGGERPARNEGRNRDASSAGDEDRGSRGSRGSDQEGRSDRSARGGRSDRNQGQNYDKNEGRRERDSESDSDEPRKKRAKVPTWSDAIEGLIDANIDLRKSRPSNGGRGRKRRR